jgi:hypothetical protein
MASLCSRYPYNYIQQPYILFMGIERKGLFSYIYEWSNPPFLGPWAKKGYDFAPRGQKWV